MDIIIRIMENFQKNESPSSIETDLQEKITSAKTHALSQEEYKNILDEELKMKDIESERELRDEEVNHFHEFRKRMTEATIVVETLLEAKKVMEILGFSNDSLINTLSHENAHANKAEQLGAYHLGYKFCLIKTNNGDFLVQPQASIDIPRHLEKEEQNKMLSEIIFAPDEYNNKLSEGDREDLEHL